MNWPEFVGSEARSGLLRSKLSGGGKVRAIEVHSGLSAMVAAESVGSGGDGSEGFDALWISSLTSSAARGLPDMELGALERRYELVEEVILASALPIIVDLDTGGDPVHFEMSCRRLEASGVSAVVVEDKCYPKRNSLSLDCSHVLEDPDAFAEKLRRGMAARPFGRMMVFARLESLIAGAGVADALARGRRFVEAGVDGILIHSKQQDPGEIYEFLDRWRQEMEVPVHIAAVPTTYHSVTDHELFGQGVDIVIYANHLLRAACRAMKDAAESILNNSRALECSDMCTSVGEIFRLTGYDAAVERDQFETVD